MFNGVFEAMNRQAPDAILHGVDSLTTLNRKPGASTTPPSTHPGAYEYDVMVRRRRA